MRTKLVMYINEGYCVDVCSEDAPEIWKATATFRSHGFGPLKEYLISLGFFKKDVEEAEMTWVRSNMLRQLLS